MSQPEPPLPAHTSTVEGVQGEQPEVLMWAEYPGGQFRAAVQANSEVVYFIVQGPDHFGGPRLVWVRNLVPAPLNFSKREQDAYRPPLLPSSYCNHPKGGPPLDVQKLKIVWFEQGCGAALVEGDQVLALVPPQVQKNLPSYARDCLHPCQVAMPLDQDDDYQQRVPSCQDYWQQWAGGQMATDANDRILDAYRAVLGDPKEQFSGQADQWPPIGLARFQTDDAIYLATMGASLRCQPAVEQELQNYEDHQRLEIGLQLPLDSTQQEVQGFFSRLLSLARYPWHHQTFFLPKHTFQWNPKPKVSKGQSEVLGNGGKIYQATFLPESIVADSGGRTEIKMSDFRHQPVNLLWICPNQKADPGNLRRAKQVAMWPKNAAV